MNISFTSYDINKINSFFLNFTVKFHVVIDKKYPRSLILVLLNQVYFAVQGTKGHN